MKHIFCLSYLLLLKQIEAIKMQKKSITWVVTFVSNKNSTILFFIGKMLGASLLNQKAMSISPTQDVVISSCGRANQTHGLHFLIH